MSKHSTNQKRKTSQFHKQHGCNGCGAVRHGMTECRTGCSHFNFNTKCHIFYIYKCSGKRVFPETTFGQKTALASVAKPVFAKPEDCIYP